MSAPAAAAPLPNNQPPPAAGGPPPGGSRIGRVVGAVLAVLVLLALLVVAAVLVLTNTDWGREQLRRRVVAALSGSVVHGRLKVGRISGNLLKGIGLHDVAVTDSAGAPFVRADSASVRYTLRDFLSKKIELAGLTLWRPDVVLDRPPGGDWNFARIFPSDTTQADTSTAPGFGDHVVIRGARVVDGRVTVRTPFAPPDTFDTGARLTAAQKDSAARAALDTASRARVVAVPGGYQQVQELQRLHAGLPLLRIAHPDHKSQRFEVDSLRTLAFVFRPPAADIRQLRGALELTGDSLWARDLAVQLPNSRAVATLRYDFNTGAVAASGRAAPVALADARFALPSLPEGTVTAGYEVTLAGARQRYAARGLDVRATNPDGSTATARGTVALATASGAAADSAGGALRVDSTDVTFANVSTGLAAAFAPGARLPVAGTANGRVAASGTLEALRLDADLTLDERRTGRSRVRAAGEVGVDDGVVRARALRVALDPVQVPLARQFAPDLQLPVGGTLRGTATVDGSSAAGITARAVDLTHADRTGTSRLTGAVTVALAQTGAVAARRPATAPSAAGGVVLRRVDANLQLRPIALATLGRFAPTAGLRGTVSGPVRVTGNLDALRVDARLGFAGPRGRSGGALDVNGRVGLGRVLSYDLAVAPRALDAGAITTKAPATALTGRIAARGRGTDPATARATLAADLNTLRVDTVGVDSVRARLGVGGGVLSVDALAVRAPRAALDAAGRFGLAAGRSGELSYRLAVDSLGAYARFFPRDTGAVAPRPAANARRVAAARADSARLALRNAVAVAAGERAAPAAALGDTLRPQRRDSVGGAVYAAGVLTGGVRNFGVRGRAGVEGLALLGSSARRARVAYTGVNVGTPGAAFAAALAGDSLVASGFALDSVDVRATYRGVPGRAAGTAQLAVYQDVGRSYSARADYAFLPDRTELRFDDLRLRFDTTAYASTRPGAVRFGARGVEVEQIELVNPAGGRIAVDGRLPQRGDADLRARLEDVEVADLLGLVQSDVAFRGRAALDARVTGPLAAPLVRATAALTGGNYGGTEVPDVAVDANYAARRLTATAEASVAGRRPPRGSDPGVPVPRRRILVADAALPVNLALQGATGPRLDSTAAVTVNARLDSVPLDLASRFTDAASDVAGTALGTVAVRGTVARPDVAGDLRLVDARARLAATGALFRDVNAAVRLRGDTVVLDSLAGLAGGGRVRLAGGVGIRTPARPAFDLRLVADNARVLDNEQGRVQADAQVSVYGPFNAVNVTGGARVRGGVIYVPESDSRQTLSADDPAVFAVVDTARLRDRDVLPSRSPLLENLRVDLLAGVDRDTWVRSREANVEIHSDGDLRLRVDRARQALALDGVILTDRGDYTFLGKRFQIKRGAVTFVNTQQLDPDVQLTAEYEVAQAGREPLNIQIQVGGSVTAPKVSLDSDAQPPIAQTELFSYLAFGNPTGSLPVIGGSTLSSPTPGGSQVGAAANVATKRLAGVALGVIVDNAESRLGRSLGADVINITPGGELSPELATQRGLEVFVRSTQFEFGKYLNRQLFVGLQTTPSFYRTAPYLPGFRVQYRFARTPGLSLEAVSQPRFFLFEPSLGAPRIEQFSPLGVFLQRQWRF
jgi:translocation and assembly module TamB